MGNQVQYLDTRDGCRLAYIEQGKGLPLVLIHGWTFDKNIWSSQLPVLGQYFRTITYDRRGYGESSGAIDISRDLDDLDDLLNHLAIEKTCLLGMSQGGRVALRYAITRPEKLIALILQCAPLDGYIPPKSYEHDHIPLNLYSNYAKQGDIQSVRNAWMDHQLMKIPPDKKSVERHVREIVNRYSCVDLAGDIMDNMAFQINIADNLGNIKVPTLIIQGDEETPMIIDVANKLNEGIQGSKKILIKGNGHLINLIEPEQYNQAVINFLKENN